MVAKVESFVHVAEVWIPDGELLRRHSGAYGGHRAFDEASAELRFERGQGLPGEAWRALRPVVWQELDRRFTRHELAANAGLDAGLAFPVFRGEQLLGIVSLLCGSREHTGGCIEVWQPNDLRELSLVDAYYGRLDSFAEISRLVRFQRGRGLPGVAWERGLPHVMTDLANSNSFIRASAARAAGVHAGLAVPLYRGNDITQLLVLLSAQETPLARAFEVWTVSAEGPLSLSECFYADDVCRPGDLAQPPASAPGQALAQQVAGLRMPLASGALETAGGAASGASFQLGLGIPIFDGQALRAIVILLN
ncbi:MAG: hypothetical protein JWN04_4487 [Myxococcaceae bacterium]|nr:hypothetical protein [Myxococcaceae bacterium]